MKEISLAELKAIANKMEIEKLVFDSLKHEELTDEYIDKFISVMKNAYESNIQNINHIIEMESKED